MVKIKVQTDNKADIDTHTHTLKMDHCSIKKTLIPSLKLEQRDCLGLNDSTCKSPGLSYLYSRHREVWYLKADLNRRPTFTVLRCYTWKTKVRSHQVVLATLQ